MNLALILIWKINEIQDFNNFSWTLNSYVKNVCYYY